ncbi:predicted protein, partial [Nematostella vectensis]
MNQYLNTEIVCTLAGLGCAEGTEYYKSPDCLESLKDLIKFLRRDDSTCEIRRQLGNSKVLENDLIAIVKSCTPKEQDIFDMVIRLMVNLTQPAALCFEHGKIPEDKTGQHYYLELVNQLQSYKEAFTDKEAMAVIGRELSRTLQKDWDDRQEEDYLLIERVLLLIRNILHVPANPQAEKRTDDDASIHDQVVWGLHQNGVDDLLLYIASSPDERRWCMHTLEIISLMLREQNPESLARAGDSRSKSEKSEDVRQLETIRERELAEKKKNAKKFSGRHSRFGGTFYINNMMSIADKRQMIYHHSVADAKNLTFDREKSAPRKRKNQIIAKEMTVERRSTLSIRLFLQGFCKQFLEHCYNPLLYVVRDNLMHERSQENDESYFLWAMKFFMEFTRHFDFRVDFVGETMSVSNFQYVLKILMQYYDSFVEDKQNPVTWGRRLHLAVQAYKELLMYVLFMEKSNDETLRSNAKVIKANIFYMVEYRDVFLFLVRKFDKSKQSKAYLRDLVETFHVFLKMLEDYCSGKSHIVIQQKKKKKKTKKRKSKQAPARVNLSAEQADEMWQAMASELSSWIQGHNGTIPESVVPFDAASDIPIDQQRVSALSRIQTQLQNCEYGESIALLRAAREVWPNDSFGAADGDPEDEFMCLHDIFKMTDLPIETTPLADAEAEVNEEEILQLVESKFISLSCWKFPNFLSYSRLACPSILQPYCWLLGFYRENSAKTNHYLVKMLHRVAVDLKIVPMMFQLSLFVTFNRVLHDPAASQYKEMVKFARYILGNFFEMLPKNPVLCVELSTWKTTDACYEISEGYGSLQNRRSLKKSGATWSYEEEEELKSLYHQYQEGEDDVIDKILDNLQDDTRTRRQIINKLFLLGLVTDKRAFRKPAAKKGAWGADEEEQLRAVYEEYKQSDGDIVEKILSHLTNTSRSRRQVVNQLVKMGLVEDRKTLRKKRKPGEKRGTLRDEGEEDASDYLSSSSDSESDNESLDQTSVPTLVSSLKDCGNIYLIEYVNREPDIALSTFLFASGLQEQLEWIQSQLRRVAEDREDGDNWQAYPLVTITEENEEALSNSQFRAMLKKIGLVPPVTGQQTFWRIPIGMRPAQLRQAADELEGKRHTE